MGEVTHTDKGNWVQMSFYTSLSLTAMNCRKIFRSTWEVLFVVNME